MILSATDIKNFIDSGKITISNFNHNNLNPASYAFNLGENLLKPIGEELIDFRKGLLPEYQEIRIDANGYQLNPGEFVLGQTEEVITLSPEVAMIIEGRSALARCGIEVTQTSSFIEPDHSHSIITLEIKNSGKSPFMLYSSMKFAKGIFMKLLSPQRSGQIKSSYISQEEVDPPKNLPGFFN